MLRTSPIDGGPVARARASTEGPPALMVGDAAVIVPSMDLVLIRICLGRPERSDLFDEYPRHHPCDNGLGSGACRTAQTPGGASAKNARTSFFQASRRSPSTKHASKELRASVSISDGPRENSAWTAA